MAIKVYCDCCSKECNDTDFLFEATKMESVISLTEGNIGAPQKRTQKQLIQICKGCFYKFLSKHLKNEK